MLSLVETVLFKTYVLYFPSMVGPLIRVENLCDKAVVVSDLKDKKMYKELIDFYYYKGMHHDALEFLFDFHGHSKDEQSEANINARDFIIKYLMLLPNEKLDDLFYYLTKLLGTINDIHVRNEILVSIFENNNIINLKRDSLKIYNYVDGIDKSLSLKYLEFASSTINDVNPEIYNHLVKRYVFDLNNANKNKLEDFLKNSNLHYNPSDVILILKSVTSDHTVSIETKNFILLMQVYPYYRLKEHEISIDILFNKLGDYKKAQEYCNKIYVDNTIVGSKMLIFFLKEIIEKEYYGKENESKKELLVIFLKDYRDKLDIVEALKAIPLSVPVKDIKDLLIYSLRHKKMRNEDLSLKKNIMRNELTNLNYSINHKSADFIGINSKNICCICKKRFHSFTTESIFWFYTSNEKEIIVHYNCRKSLESRLRKNKQRLTPSSKTQKMDLSELRKYIFGHNT